MRSISHSIVYLVVIQFQIVLFQRRWNLDQGGRLWVLGTRSTVVNLKEINIVVTPFNKYRSIFSPPKNDIYVYGYIFASLMRFHGSN
jgi:hypothetical protein